MRKSSFAEEQIIKVLDTASKCDCHLAKKIHEFTGSKARRA
jgi:hypothetical protein